MFDRLSSVSCIEETGEEFEDLKKLIVAHLQSMEYEFQRYFPELEEQEAILVQNPFSASLDASGIPDKIQINILILRMTHLLAFSTTKSHSLNFGVKCMIHTHRFLSWLFKYYCPLLQRIYVRVVFQVFCI